MPLDPRSPQARTAPDHKVWSPLRGDVFRAVWIAAVFAIAATWMQDVGAGWLMKDLTGGDPLMVALVQAATSLPVMLLVVPAGTLGDLVDRRRFLLWALGWLTLASGAATLLSLGAVKPGWLLALTLLAGAGKAMILPGFAAAGAELAERSQLHLAVGLHSVANNAGRIVGPGIAGALVVGFGVPAVFGATLLAYLLAALLVLSIPRDSFGPRDGPRPGFVAALLAGVAHCWRDPVFRRVALRVATFFVCAIGIHALLPLMVSDGHWFGIGWALYGVGAIAGAFFFPRIVTRVRTAMQLTVGIALHAATLALLSLHIGDAARSALLLVAGFAWYVVVSAAQLAVQRELPDALRARGMAVFTIIMMGGFVAGALLWGTVARSFGVSSTLQWIAATSLAALALTVRLRLQRPGAPPA